MSRAPGADPRCKLLLALVLFAFPLASYSLVPLALDYAAALLMGLAGGSARTLARIQLPAVSASLIVALMEILAGYSAASAAATGVRFLDLVTALSAFYLTTSIDEVGSVLRWLRVPRGAVTWIAISLRFVPTIARDISAVLEAQSSRGMGYGGIVDWIRGLPSIITPAMVSSLIRGREVAEAMEIRGYRPRLAPRREPLGMRGRPRAGGRPGARRGSGVALRPSL
jgi:ABC-type cobalt transport system, permease component CbiQ and related transporters